MSSLIENDFSIDNIQIGGNHYKNYKIQVWDIVIEYNLGFFMGNALKYLLRNKGSKRDKIEDLKKAIHYIEKWISILESQS